MIALRTLVALISISTLILPVASLEHSQTVFKNDAKRVPVQLGVMSQCPDALFCENVFDQVLRKVGDKMELSLVYIAEIDPSEPDFGVRCKHGPAECAGNVHQLCVKKYTDFSQWWEFVQCGNYEGRYKIGRPETAAKCAKVAGFDWDESGIGECVGPNASGTGKEGLELLKDSVNLGKQMGLVKSCTIVINNEQVCTHDETWKRCENGHTVGDFVKQIEEEYAKLNS